MQGLMTDWTVHALIIKRPSLFSGFRRVWILASVFFACGRVGKLEPKDVRTGDKTGTEALCAPRIWIEKATANAAGKEQNAKRKVQKKSRENFELEILPCL